MKEEDKKKAWHDLAASLNIQVNSELNYDDVLAVCNAMLKFYKDKWKKDSEEILNRLNEITQDIKTQRELLYGKY